MKNLTFYVQTNSPKQIDNVLLLEGLQKVAKRSSFNLQSGLIEVKSIDDCMVNAVIELINKYSLTLFRFEQEYILDKNYMYLFRDINVQEKIENCIKNNKEEQTIAKKDKKISQDINIIVLANENSASASEILIGALKDNNIAKIIGTRTYGKGVMQEIVSMPIGGALKVTIEEFYTPNGDKINKTGITPDVEIEDDDNTEQDEQLQKAIEMCK